MVLSAAFDWQQSADQVVVEVPLKGCAPQSVDLYVSRLFLKVNFRPYLLAVDLFDEVDDRTGVSTIEDGVLRLCLRKIHPRLWPSLECTNHKDKTAMRARRTESMEAKSLRDQAASEQARDRRIQDEKLSTRMQMKVDELQRQRLDDLKTAEREEAERSVYATLRQLEMNPVEPATEEPSTASPRTRPQEDSKSPNPATAMDSPGPPKGILKQQDEPCERKRRVSFSDKEPEVIERELSPQAPLPGPNEGPSTIGVAEAIFSVADCEEFSSEEDARPPTPLNMGHQPKGSQSWTAPGRVTADDADASPNSDGEAPHGQCHQLEATSDAPTVHRKATSESVLASDDLEKVLPAPRSAARVSLSFTPRVFPTPMRESKREEEEDWLLRNRRHLKGKAKERLDAVDISERDPYWLKGKGDDFFQAGNFQGALNAYSCALEVDERMVACLSNRAACWLKLGKYKPCIADCDQALAYLSKEREEEIALAEKEGFSERPKEFARTRAMRKKLHVRKGTALSKLKNFHESLAEFQVAAELDPQNDELRADCARLSCLVQCATNKDLGDTAFRAGDLTGAIEAYDKALAANPDSAPCLANRSACYLKLGKLDRVIEDCAAAIQLVSWAEPTNLAEDESTLLFKLLVRRGGALSDLGRLAEGLKCLHRALEICPEDMQVAKQIKLLERANADDASLQQP